jgi:hypothetical protein
MVQKAVIGGQTGRHGNRRNAMTRTILFTVPLVAAAGLFALGANAQDTTPAQDRMSIAQIAAMLEEQGYSVLEVELERGHYDVEMIDANGMRVEAWLDPATGAVLPYGDDDGDDDDREDRDDRDDSDDD